MTTPSAASVPLSQPLYGASFGQALSRFFKKYVTFSGRASRSEYWWSALAVGLIEVVLIALIAVFIALGSGEDSSGEVQFGAGAIVFIVLLALFGLAVIIPGIAVIVRRLHYANYTGWLYLIGLTGIGSVVLLVFMLLPANPEGVRYDQ
jgi:uncharacterized membrane protein YhaH (DUF805 family)